MRNMIEDYQGLAQEQKKMFDDSMAIQKLTYQEVSKEIKDLKETKDIMRMSVHRIQDQCESME